MVLEGDEVVREGVANAVEREKARGVGRETEGEAKLGGFEGVRSFGSIERMWLLLGWELET